MERELTDIKSLVVATYQLVVDGKLTLGMSELEALDRIVKRGHKATPEEELLVVKLLGSAR